MPSAKKKVLICGATGFIGRNIAQALAARPDLEVYGTHLRSSPHGFEGVRMLSADLRDQVQVTRVLKGMDVVIQAAATTTGARDTIARPYHHVTDNAVMNSLIFRSAHELGIKQVLFFSCTVMYPSSDHALQEHEVDPAHIHDKYFGVAWTKLYCEKMAEFYSRLGTTRYTVMRHSNIYGPHDKYDLERSHVFGATVTKVMTATGSEVVVWGDGSEGRDLLYVSDLVRFVELAIDRQTQPCSLVNVGSGKLVSIRQLVEGVIRASKRRLDIRYDTSQPTIKTQVFLNCEKARQDFGWSPEVALEAGIEKTLKWYENHFQPAAVKRSSGENLVASQTP